MYTFPFTTWNTITTPFQFTLGSSFTDGSTVQIGYNSTAPSGSVEATHLACVQYEKSAPTTGISYTPAYTSGPKTWVTSTTVFTLTRSDSGGSGLNKTYYKWSGSGSHAWTQYVVPFSLTGMGNGTYTISYCSWDNAGNNETLHTITVFIDPLAPTTGIAYTPVSTSGPKNWVSNVTTFTLTPADNAGGSGVGVTRWKFSGTGSHAWTLYTVPFTLGGMGNGTYTISWCSWDNAGNNETLKRQVVYIDTIAPTTGIAYTPVYTSGLKNWVSNVTTFTLTSFDNAGGSGVGATYWKFNGTGSHAWTLYTGPFTLAGMGNGTYTISWCSWDNIGNNETLKSQVVFINTIKPTMPQTFTVFAPGDGFVTLTWTSPASNGGSPITGYNLYRGTTSGGEVLVQSGVTSPYTNTGLTNGQIYYFQVTAVNVAGEGNRSSEVSATPRTVPGTPTLTTATPGTLQVTLSWSAPASNGGSTITSYNLYRGSTSGGEFLVQTNVTSPCPNTGLTAMQLYYFEITAVNVAGEGNRSNELSATPYTVPGAPIISSIWPGNTQVMLAWTPPASNGGSAIMCYKVYSGTTSGGETWLATLGVMFTYTATSLTNGQVYYFNVSAVNVAGEGGRSTEASATPRTVPGAPTGLTATAGNAQVVLNWVAPTSNGCSAITGYNVYRGTTSGGETLLTWLGVVFTYTATSMTNGQVYYFKVSAVNAAGEGARSTEASATPRTMPGAPTGLTATAWNAQVVLNWVAPASNGGSAITGYNVYRGTTSGGETLLANPGVVLTYTATALTNGQIYYFKVSAVNVAGESARSTETSVTPPAVPSAPQACTATAGNMQVVLTWAAPANNGGAAITGYKVFQGTMSGGETLLATLGFILTYTSTGLACSQVYYFQVSAVNSVGESARSREANAIPFAVVPSTPQNVQVTAGDGQVVLTWQAPANNGGSAMTSYKIYRGTSSGSVMLYAIVNEITTTYTDTGVTNGQTYYYTITAINVAGESSQVTEVRGSPAMAMYKIILIVISCVAAGIVVIAITPKLKKRNKTRGQERIGRQIEMEPQQQAKATARPRQLELEHQQRAERTRVDKLKKLVQVSETLKISQMAQILDMDEATLLDRVVDWAVMYGFTLDEDVVEFTGGRKDDFISTMDDAFADWSEQANTKEGKSE